jgi:Tol biopolymer transport system component
MAICAAGLRAQDRPTREVQYYNPAWSPDGRSIAFESDRDGTFAVYVVASDGTRLTKLTPDGIEDSQPAWSPDGARLVFTSNQDAPGHLWLMDATGGNRRRLTSASDRRDFYASFSPDGRWIVLGAQDAGDRGRYFVAVVSVDGTTRRELTDSTTVAEGPRWTADGDRVVFTVVPRLERNAGETMRELAARMNAQRRTVSMRPDGSAARTGRDAEADVNRVRDPARSPDGRWLAEGKVVNGVRGLYVRELATGRDRLVVGPR